MPPIFALQYIQYSINSPIHTFTQYTIMGTTNTKPKCTQQQTLTTTPTPTINHTELESMHQSNNLDQNDDEDEMMDELMNTPECCGGMISGKYKNKRMLSWEDHVLEYCDRNRGRILWVEDVRTVVKSKAAGKNRKVYMKDYNDIKYMQKEPSKSQREKSLNPTEIKNFKNNLKKSVLLDYNQVVNPAFNRQSSRIQSTIKLEPLNASMVNKSFHPNNAYAQNIRSSIALRQSMARQNKQNSIIMSFSKMGKSYNRQNLRQSVINLVDDTMSSLFKGQQQEISKINAYELQIFVKFTVMLQKHLTDPENKIYQIIHAFYNVLYKRYGHTQPKNTISQLQIQNKINQTVSGSLSMPQPGSSVQQQPASELSNLEIQQILENTKSFIGLLAKIVEDYYNIKTFGNVEEGTNYLINNYENILTVISAIVFKDEKFYHFIFNFIKVFNKQNDERARTLFKSIHGKSPQSFSIRREYCLNASTFKKFIDQMSSVEIPQDLQSTSDQPYHQCAECLLKVIKSRTPISKMKAILQCAQKITESIIEFYQNNQMPLKNKKIDADQVLSIFCYILSLKEIPDIFSQVFMIEYFATEHQKISMTGYYFTVFSCAVEENFSEMKLEKYEEQKEEMGRMVKMGRIEQNVEEESRLTSRNGSEKKPRKRETNAQI